MFLRTEFACGRNDRSAKESSFGELVSLGQKGDDLRESEVRGDSYGSKREWKEREIEIDPYMER